MLVDQVVKLRLRLDSFETKLESAEAGNGTWTDVDARIFNSLSNQLRLGLRELHARANPGRGKRRTPFAAGFSDLVAARRDAVA
jgi:hypothetical protein